MLKVPMPPVLVKVVSEDGKLEKVYQLSLSAKAPTGSAIPEEGVKNLVHTKPELVIEPEEMDFERLERPNADLPKGEKRVVQEGQKGRKLRLVEVSQEMEWNLVRKSMLCRTRASGRNYRGGY